MCSMFETKDLTEEQKDKCIKSEYQIPKQMTDDNKFKYARSDIIEKVVQNCRGAKKAMMV